MQRLHPAALTIMMICAAALSGCEQLGLEDGKAVEAEGKAIGAACRHAGRALEDCYQLNSKAPKAAIFTGWKDMNDYMTEQKLEVVKPTLPPTLPKPKKKADAENTQSETDKTDDAGTDTDASAPADLPKDGEAKGKKTSERADGKPDAKTAARKPATER